MDVRELAAELYPDKTGFTVAEVARITGFSLYSVRKAEELGELESWTAYGNSRPRLTDLDAIEGWKARRTAAGKKDARLLAQAGAIKGGNE